jgi:type IV pilus assembly protein PilY1
VKTYRKWLNTGLLLASFFSVAVQAEDIDVFAGTNAVDATLPNVIFVLDNTSNWSRESQQWPGGLAQGQSEVRAIANALIGKTNKINVGLVEFTTQGTANQNGAYVRFRLQELTTDSQLSLNTTLGNIFTDISDPIEKRNSNTEYGNLMYDFYNYLSGGNQSFAGGGTPASLADTSGEEGTGAYASQFGEFRSPLQAADACVDTYLIFIGNPNSSGPSEDDAINSRALAALYDSVGEVAPDQFAANVGNDSALGMPEFRTTSTTESGASRGTSNSCWKITEASECSVGENSTGGRCDGVENCSCTTVSSDRAGCITTGNPANRTTRWNVATGASITTVVELTGQVDETGGAEFNLDDWTKFLRNYGVPFSAVFEGETISERVSVITYTIDVFNAQQNAETSALLFSAANVGGGSYFEARSEAAITTAINSALGDILADSSSFAAVSLPLSATNRAQVDNQVYIGMFRPSLGKEPRWFGNLKRYQLALFNNIPRLADANLRAAIIGGKGFIRECAESFWSEGTGAYWENLGVQPPPLSKCDDPDVLTSPWSDLPDGPFVEKGGVAQQTRQLADASERTLYTVGASALRPLADTDATALGGQTVLDYLRGDQRGTDEVMPAEGLRATIHGDVVHSRPLSIRYDADTIGLIYGSNDGFLRAVDPADGSEKWALIAPEHFAKIQRLYDNTPLIRFTGAIEVGSVSKDYFFDGSTGDIVVYDADGALELAYIYPTMRRGGRMVYALDVTDPDAAPSLLWRQGCPNLDNDTDCSADFTNIGQTWSTPIGGYAAGYVDDSENPKLVVAFGGGFDDCLNEDVAAYPSSCSSAKGKGVYILDAATGVRLKYLATDAPVTSELASIDIDFDGSMDFAYAADVAGNVYRVSFATLTDENPEGAVTPLPVDEWTIFKIGSTSDNERRFYNAPTVGVFQGTVFVSIGSGDRERPLEINYPFASQVQNRFYTLVDKPFKTFIVNPGGTPLEVDEYTTVNLDGDTMYVVEEPQAVADEGLGEDEALTLRSFDGWYMDLADRGEQVFNPAAMAGGKVFFNTLQPGGDNGGLCQAPKGIGTGYAVSLFAPEYTEGNQIPGDNPPIPPVIATVRVPPGLPDCDGPDCPQPPEDPCASGSCEVVTVCIGCEGFEPVQILPEAPPVRRLLFFTEDIDRTE